ncbi:hypothetical protein EUTSA_v10012363mg, partial [Eutrema salsugineum]
MSEKKIVLKSSDGKTIDVAKAVALQSQTITHMVEDSCVGNEIPFENVTGQVLAKVIEYCKKHVVVDGETLTCKTVAHVIHTRTIDEIRTFFNVENDYTPRKKQ